MSKYSKRIGWKATVLAAALAALPLASLAAGLGRITVHSALGQPLKAELEITASRDELPSITVNLAGSDAFRQAGIEYAPALANLRFARDIKERNGRRFVEISTDRPLNEPFVDMLVVLKWASGTLVREYTFLLDPPELAKPQVAPVTAPEVKPEPVPLKPAAPAATQLSPEEKKPAGIRIPAMSSKSSAAPVERKVGTGGTAERTVKSGDTLGKIAAEVKPEGVSLDQMLVALFRSNRDAFDGANMNRLKAGKIISVPDVEAAKGIDAKEAKKEIVTQSADFNAYRKKLAAGVAAEPPKADDTKRSATGKIAPRVEDKAPVAVPGKDKLQVSPTEAGKSGGKQAIEDKVAKERALKEANSRIAELEKNLADMKKLAELKSQAGADLQKQAQAAQAAKPAAPVADKKPEPAAPATKPAEPPKPAEAGKPPAAPATVPAKPGDAAKPAEATKADAAKPAEAPKAEAAKPAEGAKPGEPPKPDAAKPADAPKPPPKKPAPPPPPEPEPDFLEENGPLVFGGAGIIALLLGYLGFAAYRKKKAAEQDAADDAIPNSVYTSSSVFATTGGQTVDTSATAETNFSVQDTTVGSAAENVDPVVEADTYLAFGRDAQAEEILMEALKKEPTRHAVHLKLLEIYSARKAKPQFQTLAEDLKSQTGGQGAEWERAAAMGIALDPSNALYQAVSAVSAAAPPEPAAMDFSATVIVSPQEKTAVMEAAVLAVPPPPAEPPAPQAEEVATLDFDLDLGAPAEPAQEATADAAPAADDVAALDFDLDLGKPSAEVAPAAVPAAGLDIEFDASPPTMAAPSASTPEEMSVDFSLDLPASDAPTEPTVTVSAADGNEVDFNFELPAPAAGEAAPAAAPALDLGGISLELDTPPAAETVSAPSLSLDMPLDGEVPSDAAADAAPASAADNPEVTTKLELAQAYQEMGDRDGARELYEEAVREGSASQQELARSKLAELG